jgi:hypothetical protein
MLFEQCNGSVGRKSKSADCVQKMGGSILDVDCLQKKISAPF